jgi:hypothetical protein
MLPLRLWGCQPVGFYAFDFFPFDHPQHYSCSHHYCYDCGGC